MDFFGKKIAELESGSSDNEFLITALTQPKAYQIFSINVKDTDKYPRGNYQHRVYYPVLSAGGYTLGLVFYDRSSARNVHATVISDTLSARLVSERDSGNFDTADDLFTSLNFNNYAGDFVAYSVGEYYTSSPDNGQSGFWSIYVSRTKHRSVSDSSGNYYTYDGYGMYTASSSDETYSNIAYDEETPYWTSYNLEIGNDYPRQDFSTSMFNPNLIEHRYYSNPESTNDRYVIGDETVSLGTYTAAIAAMQAISNAGEPTPPSGGGGVPDNDYGYDGDYGGEGDGYPDSETLPFEVLPTLDYGRLFLIATPTVAQVSALITWLSSNDLPDVISRMWIKPLGAIISVLALPFSVVDQAQSGTLYIGNFNTELTMNYLKSGYVEKTLGSPIYIEAPTDTYLDYETQISVFIPYIGEVHLNPIEVVGKYIKVIYHIDIVTGAFIVYLYVAKDAATLTMNKCDTMYMYGGNMGQNIPITAENHNALVTGIAGEIGSIGLATAGASKLAANPLLGAIGIAAGVGTLVSSAASMTKQDFDSVGSLGSSTSMLSRTTGYVKLTYPRANVNTDGITSLKGYTSHLYRKLGDLSGFTIIDEVHLENIGAFDEEITEIEELLKEGVIL